MNKLILFALLVIIAGCTSSPNKDGWIVKAQDGKYYRLTDAIGDRYFLKEIDSISIKFMKP